MKVQILINFIAKYTVSEDNPKDEFNSKSKQIETLEANLASVWVIHIDGQSNT